MDECNDRPTPGPVADPGICEPGGRLPHYQFLRRLQYVSKLASYTVCLPCYERKVERKGQFTASNECSKRQMLSASGATRGSAPGPRWGLCPQTPVIGLRYRARHVPPPN